MAIHTDLADFSGQCRLFPLPDVVLFPHVILPLHIFEPRYRQMTQDALESDRLVTIVKMRPLSPGSPWSEPVPIMDVACVGRIVQHEPLPDGRFNILVLGCKRVQLGPELPGTKLYRIAEASVLEDEPWEEPADSPRYELIGLFLEVLQMKQRLDDELAQLLHSQLPLGILSDIIAHALELPASIKQNLLSQRCVGRRVKRLLRLLHVLRRRATGTGPYPPHFSLN